MDGLSEFQLLNLIEEDQRYQGLTEILSSGESSFCTIHNKEKEKLAMDKLQFQEVNGERLFRIDEVKDLFPTILHVNFVDFSKNGSGKGYGDD